MQIYCIILLMIDLYKDNHVRARMCAFVNFYFKKNFSAETTDHQVLYPFEDALLGEAYFVPIKFFFLPILNFVL